MGGLADKDNQLLIARLEPLVQPQQWQQDQWQALLQGGLPAAGQEAWKYTPLESFNQLPFCAVENQCIDNLAYEGLSAGFDCYRLVFFDGQLSVRHSDWIPMARITPLDALTEVEQANMTSAVSTDPMALLTDATATSGVLIEVERGTELNKPIYLFHLNSGAAGELCSYRHHVELGALASCEVIEHHVSLNQGGGVSLARLTANVGDGAHLYHSKLIEEGQAQHHFGHNDISLQRDASARSVTVMLDGALVRHQTSSALLQANGHVEMNSLALPRQDQVFDSRTFLRHKAEHCPSHQTHKILAADRSCGVFEGMIYVHPQALKTDGLMDNHNLILGDKAQVNSKPQLEIYADDVKCSHGATTGQLDKNQIEYLRARGIRKQQAREMITFAFASEVTESMHNPAIRKYADWRVRRILGKVA